MNILTKAILTAFSLSFAFVIVSGKELNNPPSYKSPSSPLDEIVQEEPKVKERHHSRW